MKDRIATTEARPEGFYWVILGANPPEIAYWERGEWWAGRRFATVAGGGGDRCQRPPGVQASPGARGMMIRGNRRHFGDDLPAAEPLFGILIWIVAAGMILWVVAMTMLLVGLARRFL